MSASIVAVLLPISHPKCFANDAHLHSWPLVALHVCSGESFAISEPFSYNLVVAEAHTIAETTSTPGPSIISEKYEPHCLSL